MATLLASSPAAQAAKPAIEQANILNGNGNGNGNGRALPDMRVKRIPSASAVWHGSTMVSAPQTPEPVPQPQPAPKPQRGNLPRAPSDVPERATRPDLPSPGATSDVPSKRPRQEFSPPAQSVPRVPSIPTPGTIAPGGQSATGLISGS